MKKLSILLVLVMVLSTTSFVSASAEGEYSQAPMLDERVESGELPPVEERLPENPCVIKEVLDEYLDQEVGNYGGTLRFATNSVNWDADIFVAMDEALLTMESANSDVITPNIVESYEVNEDNTVYTFKLRKGLKWSDGVELTMEDVEFGINDFVFNDELTPVVSAYMRDGGVSSGEPFTFEVVDDTTFTISFKSSYGGFAVHIAIANWKGYTDLIKPAHFLKQFHKDYAEEVHGSLEAYYEFMQPFASHMGYDDVSEEGVWVYVFNQFDCTNFECTDPNDAMPSYYFGELTGYDSFPQLYPWIMVDCSGNNFMTFERNPYYFKVDAAGQQMPYFDKLTSQYVEDVELVQFSVTAGDVDFMREAATISNIAMYRENEEVGGYTAYTTSMHNTPGCLGVNFTYGLNADGTVKDDVESQAWQEMLADKRFLQALVVSVDAEEVIDSVFHGFGEPNDYYYCPGDIDAAKDLLDEMGAVDIDGDGYRETPSGLPFTVYVYVSTAAAYAESLTCCELYYEYWSLTGLNVQIMPTDSTLLDTMINANEVPIYSKWLHGANLWYYGQWYDNNPMWTNWVNAGGLSGTLKSDDPYIEPSEEFKEFILTMQGCYTADTKTAVNVNVPKLLEMSAENLWEIQFVQNVQQCVIVNSDISNVPTGGIGISWNFAIPQMYYENPEEHVN